MRPLKFIYIPHPQFTSASLEAASLQAASLEAACSKFGIRNPNARPPHPFPDSSPHCPNSAQTTPSNMVVLLGVGWARLNGKGGFESGKGCGGGALGMRTPNLTGDRGASFSK